MHLNNKKIRTKGTNWVIVIGLIIAGSLFTFSINVLIGWAFLFVVLVGIVACLVIDKSKNNSFRHSIVSNDNFIKMLADSDSTSLKPNKCCFWNCDTNIANNHFLCSKHHGEYKRGKINKCPNCDKYKYQEYNLCLRCQNDISNFGSYSYDSHNKIDILYSPEHSESWTKKDSEAEHFFVYILQLDDNSFYAGQTRDLRARLYEHKDGKTKSTAGKDFELKYYEQYDTRESATQREVELKKLINYNEREIRKMIISFNDLHSLIK